jgi:hypothetical protein
MQKMAKKSNCFLQACWLTAADNVSHLPRADIKGHHQLSRSAAEPIVLGRDLQSIAPVPARRPVLLQVLLPVRRPVHRPVSHRPECGERTSSSGRNNRHDRGGDISSICSRISDSSSGHYLFTVGTETEVVRVIQNHPIIHHAITFTSGSCVGCQPQNRIIVSQHGIPLRVCKRPFRAEKLFFRYIQI